MTSKQKYSLKKDVFFKWYFQNKSKEHIATFLSPYFMSIVHKDVHFTLNDLLNDAKSVPSYLLENYPTDSNPNIEVKSESIRLI